MSTHSSDSEPTLISSPSLWHLWLKRFFRQTVRQLSIGLAGLLLVFVLGVEPHSADLPSLQKALPVSLHSQVIQVSSEVLLSSQPPQKQGQANLLPESLTAQNRYHRLGHSRLTTATLTHHRLTGAHLLMSEKFQQQLSANVQQTDAVMH